MKQETAEPTIPITRDEIVILRDIARGLSILDEVSSKPIDIEIIAFWWLIRKIAEPAWMLSFETLTNRWNTAHPKNSLLALD